MRPWPRAVEICRATRTNSSGGVRQRRRINISHRKPHSSFSHGIAIACGLIITVGSIYHAFEGPSKLYAASPSIPVDVKTEKVKRRTGLSKEENRDSISSQHLQVKRSWENPGVYAWGSNSGRVVAPEIDDNIVRLPRRIPFFDNVLLRDIKLDRSFGAAITERGDLLQWGTGFSPDARQPSPTLSGKNLISLEISRDRIIALSKNGKVYSIPISKEDQESGPKPSERSWIPFLSSTSQISYRLIQPPKEKVCSISSGLEHTLLLTSSGRLFSAASSSDAFPDRGQMGIPGLSWTTRPPGAHDQPHEITTLRGFDIAAIATGDYHSLALDREGRVFAFGDNTSGQLGFEPSSESPCIDAPSLLPLQRLYASTGFSPKVTSIAAGGSNTFFTVDATRIAKPGENISTALIGRISADTWSCGQGILGTLGNGRWTHVQGTPTKIKALSDLFEYDEVANRVIPIRLKRLSVGATHVSATMDNVTHVAAGTSPATDSENDTNWGADVVWWGGNEFWQLGLGRRNNVAVPGYIAPLDAVPEGREKWGRREREHRFQITPRHSVRLGEGFDGRKVSVEQRVECGRGVTAVYSGT
ncbi:MAG: hypothetical protein HETSPECPRED_005305 [Heterodermia speciosa]|uniref:Uncharacterized protein n=1 Tax=Heterodermia speciosa TaxID=116794 RepID=A0A8H3ICU8_9LECA|nr:MAG: hypothetical protein HETSPECPRED_005305 [Heterodermia speciosa]